HDLTDAQRPQPADDGRAEHEREEQRGHHRAGRPERDVPEQVEQNVLIRQRRQQMKQHRQSPIRAAASPPAQSRSKNGSKRSSATPREAFSNTTSRPRSLGFSSA